MVCVVLCGMVLYDMVRYCMHCMAAYVLYVLHHELEGEEPMQALSPRSDRPSPHLKSCRKTNAEMKRRRVMVIGCPTQVQDLALGLVQPHEVHRAHFSSLSTSL